MNFEEEKGSSTKYQQENMKHSENLYEQRRAELQKEGNYIAEPTYAYAGIHRKQGGYTVEDYRNWPEDQRVELIDGEIIEMEGPKPIHQLVISFLVVQFFNFVQRKKGSCVVMPGPVDVRLDEDERTMVQPDLIVLCNRERILPQEIYGVPDFLLEVLSPSNRSHDLVRKKNKYLAAGVREYWIVDLEKDRLLTYVKEKEYQVSIYPLRGKVGVAIYGNELEIDLDLLMEYVKQAEIL